MVQFLFTNKDVESLKGLYRIMANGFVSFRAPSAFLWTWNVCPPALLHHSAYLNLFCMSANCVQVPPLPSRWTEREPVLQFYGEDSRGGSRPLFLLKLNIIKTLFVISLNKRKKLLVVILFQRGSIMIGLLLVWFIFNLLVPLRKSGGINGIRSSWALPLCLNLICSPGKEQCELISFAFTL